MTKSEVIRLVAGREIGERVRSKAFRISAGVSLAFILAVAILPGVLADDGPTTYEIGVYGGGADQLAARLPSSPARRGTSRSASSGWPTRPRPAAWSSRAMWTPAWATGVSSSTGSWATGSGSSSRRPTAR